MDTESHLPVNETDHSQDLLHGTQLILMNSAGKRSEQLNSLKVTAYVSGKKALFVVNNVTNLTDHIYIRERNMRISV